MNQQLSRQGFLGQDSSAVLEGLEVAIIGLGGGGSHIVQQLAHVGVGGFVLADPDITESSNLNRLIGGTRNDADAGVPKVEVAHRMIRAINPVTTVRKYFCRWQEVAEYLRSADIIFGCVDTFSCRRELEIMARRFMIPYVDIGMDVHRIDDGFSITGQVAISIPGEPCLTCMNIIRPALLALEANAYGSAGPRAQVVWANGVLASTAVGEMVQLFTPWHTREMSLLLEYDGNRNEVVLSSIQDFLVARRCTHFDCVDDLGDPWFRGAHRQGPIPRCTSPSANA